MNSMKVFGAQVLLWGSASCDPNSSIAPPFRSLHLVILFSHPIFLLFFIIFGSCVFSIVVVAATFLIALAFKLRFCRKQ